MFLHTNTNEGNSYTVKMSTRIGLFKTLLCFQNKSALSVESFIVLVIVKNFYRLPFASPKHKILQLYEHVDARRVCT